MQIGIIGFGFVGKSVAELFKFTTDRIWIYDKYNDIYDSFDEVIDNSEIIFICVPTPVQDNSYLFNLTFIESVFKKIYNSTFEGVIAIKSTLTETDLSYLYDKYSSDYYHIIYNPEFLTERLYKTDSRIGQVVILGLHNEKAFEEAGLLVDLYKEINVTKIHITNYKIAALVKLVSNTFSALKISFCNLIYHSFFRSKEEYETFRQMWLDIGFISPLHTNVPGQDGFYGFGGKCLPKDIKAFISELDVMNMQLREEELESELKENIKDQLVLGQEWMENLNIYNLLVREF